ncbi:hypothetical protein GYMC10_5721 [Paenibacillus sp. Y412MC10]|nr:hypothetical protein GYMC10_5721 [Paenibacillus sp. Y412MC10]
MWNWCYVFDQVNFETCCLQGTNCCFTTSTRTFNHDFHRFHTVFHSRFGSCFSSHLRSERGRLTGTFKSKAAGACPRNRVSVRIRNRYDCIVERGADMSHATFNIFAVTTFSTYDFFWFSHCLLSPFLISSCSLRYDEDLYVYEHSF